MVFKSKKPPPCAEMLSNLPLGIIHGGEWSVVAPDTCPPQTFSIVKDRPESLLLYTYKPTKWHWPKSAARFVRAKKNEQKQSLDQNSDWSAGKKGAQPQGKGAGPITRMWSLQGDGWCVLDAMEAFEWSLDKMIALPCIKVLASCLIKLAFLAHC